MKAPQCALSIAETNVRLCQVALEPMLLELSPAPHPSKGSAQVVYFLRLDDVGTRKSRFAENQSTRLRYPLDRHRLHWAPHVAITSPSQTVVQLSGAQEMLDLSDTLVFRALIFVFLQANYSVGIVDLPHAP